MKYVSAKEVKELYHITGTTLKRWKETGNIRFKQISPKKILYILPETSEEVLNYKKVTIGFVSNADRNEEIDIINYAYKQINSNIEITKFYDDSYINTDDPINKIDGEYSMLGKILNDEVSNLILSKPIKDFDNFSNLLFILKNAAMKKINIYIFDKNDMSFKIYTGIAGDMVNTLTQNNKKEIEDYNEDLRYFKCRIKEDHKDVKILKIDSNDACVHNIVSYNIGSVITHVCRLAKLDISQTAVINNYFETLLNPDCDTKYNMVLLEN